MPVQVSPSLNIFGALTYNYNGDTALLKPGVRVVVPVGNRIATAWITDIHSDYKGKVKDIIAVIRDDHLPDSRYIHFVKTIANIYFTSVGNLLDAALPPSKKPIGSIYFRNIEKEGEIEKLNKYSLNELQRLSASGTIEGFYKNGEDAPVPPEPGPEPVDHVLAENRFIIGFLRETRYRELIDDCLSRGKSVLVTVPDNLTAAYLAEKLALDNVDIYNSEIKPKARNTLWRNYALEGKTGVVVGGLSAVLLPIANPGLIISEKVGSPLYKRRYYSRYNIHFLSHLRAGHYNIPLVEGFSSHTVQSFRNRSHLVIEDNRQKQIAVEVRMVRGRSRGIPEDFIELVSGYFADNKKILVVLNRKESFNFLFCRKCRKILRCPKCDGLIDVDHDFNMKCLRCGLEKASCTHCTGCPEKLSVVEDISIASVKKAIRQRVVETGIMTLSSEGLKEEHLYSVMRRVEASSVVISTPVILNAYFNHLFDAVIYLRPESLFNIDEYDAAEKIFSMAAELRELVKSGGTLDIFSTFHFHYALKLIDDENAFFERELKYREWFQLPPFANMYHIEVRDRSLRKLGKEMRVIYKKYKEPLNIKRIYLTGRQAVRGVYKGILEAHTLPKVILKSGLLGKRNISIDLILI